MKRYLLPLFILVVAAVVSTTLSVPPANRMVVVWIVPAINRVVAALVVPLTGWSVVALFSIALVVFGTLHILIELIFKRETYLMRSPLADLRRSMVDLAKRTSTLEAASQDLEMFKSRVSHDLSSPRRSAGDFSQALLDEYQRRLNGGANLPDNLADAIIGTASAAREPAPVAWREWLALLRQRYLQDFIKNGGATVKFVIPWDDMESRELWNELQQASEEDSYTFCYVDAASTRING